MKQELGLDFITLVLTLLLQHPVVRLFITLQLDSIAMPAYLTKVPFPSYFFFCLSRSLYAAELFLQDNPGPDKAALVVQFPSPNSTKPIPSLLISPRIER